MKPADLRDRAKQMRNEITDDGKTAEMLEDAADEIERLCLFERYSNSVVQGQVEDALRAKRDTGKYPFED